MAHCKVPELKSGSASSMGSSENLLKGPQEQFRLRAESSGIGCIGQCDAARCFHKTLAANFCDPLRYQEDSCVHKAQNTRASRLVVSDA